MKTLSTTLSIFSIAALITSGALAQSKNDQIMSIDMPSPKEDIQVCKYCQSFNLDTGKVLYLDYSGTSNGEPGKTVIQLSDIQRAIKNIPELSACKDVPFTEENFTLSSDGKSVLAKCACSNYKSKLPCKETELEMFNEIKWTLLPNGTYTAKALVDDIPPSYPKKDNTDQLNALKNCYEIGLGICKKLDSSSLPIILLDQQGLSDIYFMGAYRPNISSNDPGDLNKNDPVYLNPESTARYFKEKTDQYNSTAFYGKCFLQACVRCKSSIKPFACPNCDQDAKRHLPQNYSAPPLKQ